MFSCSVCSAASGSASDVTPLRWSNQQRPGPGLGPVRRAWNRRGKQRWRNRDDPQNRAVLVRDGDPEFWSPTHVRSGSAAGLGQPAELPGQLDVSTEPNRTGSSSTAALSELFISTRTRSEVQFYPTNQNRYWFRFRLSGWVRLSPSLWFRVNLVPDQTELFGTRWVCA